MAAIRELELVDNSLYDNLGERWYLAQNHPVALLRAEARLRNPWVTARLLQQHGPSARVLDIGCGAGFLTNELGRAGFSVTGLDSSKESLAVARAYDETGNVRYVEGDATSLPFASASFDAVAAMDLLEHVEQPSAVIREAARVLRPRGTFFFHTFNRSWLSWLIVIKGVEWFVRNTPRNMHVLRLFITPEELSQKCREAALDVVEMLGNAPVVWSGAFLRMLLTRSVPPDLRFEFRKSLRLGYTGLARLALPSEQLQAE